MDQGHQHAEDPDPRRFSTDPAERVAYLKERFLDEPRIRIPAMMVVLSFFAPLCALPVVFLRLGWAAEICEPLFFWPQWGLFPFSAFASSPRVGGSRPFGVFGVPAALAFWSALILGNAALTRGWSVKWAVGSFVALGGTGLALVHLVLQTLGYQLYMEGP